MGLYVTDLLGQPITFGRASGRFFAKIVTGMIPLASATSWRVSRSESRRCTT